MSYNTLHALVVEKIKVHSKQTPVLEGNAGDLETFSWHTVSDPEATNTIAITSISNADVQVSISLVKFLIFFNLI